MLKKLLHMEAGDGFLLLIPAGIFLVIQLITGGVLLIGKPDTCVLISPVILLVVAVILSLLLVGSHGVVTFEQAVRMGITRRKALGLIFGLAAIETALLFVVGALLSGLEQLLGRFMWPLLSPGVEIHNFASVLPWWSYGAAFAGSMVAGFIGGAGIQRFGGKFGWGLWGVWMGWFLLYNRLPWDLEDIVPVIIPVVAVLIVMLLVWSVWSYLHAVIRR